MQASATKETVLQREKDGTECSRTVLPPLGLRPLSLLLEPLVGAAGARPGDVREGEGTGELAW